MTTSGSVWRGIWWPIDSPCRRWRGYCPASTRPCTHRSPGANEIRPVRRGGATTTLRVISPDYASHLLPLATLATAWQAAGERVVVASGPATASITAEFGFDRTDL